MKTLIGKCKHISATIVPDSAIGGLALPYLALFVVCFALTWNPSKSVPYIVPYIFIGGLVLIGVYRHQRTHELVIVSTIRLASLAAFVLVHSLLVHHTFNSFSIQNLAIAMVTYSAVVFLICVKSSVFRGSGIESLLVVFVMVAVFIESLFGLAQSIASYSIFGHFDSDSGDLVTGSFDLLSVEPETRGFSNPIFALNMACCFIFLSSQTIGGRLRYVVLSLCLVSFLLASVMHLSLFFLVSHGLAIALVRRKIFSLETVRGLRITFLLALVMLLSLSILMPRNFEAIATYAQNLTSFLDNQLDEYQLTIQGERKHQINEQRGKSHHFSSQTKLEAHYRQFLIIPRDYALQPIIGFGLGQYNSKAALIGTELYFGSPRNPIALPLITPYVSEPTSRYLMELWLTHVADKYPSSNTAPFSSWLAIAGELGWTAPLVLCIVIFGFIRKLAKSSEIDPGRFFSLAWLILFLLLAGFQEHYWETPQAVFTGVVLLKLLAGNLTKRRQCEPGQPLGADE